MGYINNVGKSSSVQGVLGSPPPKTNRHTMHIQEQRSVDTQTKQRVLPPSLRTVHKCGIICL